MSPDHPALAHIRRLAQEGRHEEVLTAAARDRALLENNEAMFLVGIAYAASGRFAEAEETLSRLLKRAPEITPAKAALCKVRFASGRAHDAAPLIAALEAEAEKDVQAAFLLADVYLYSRFFAKAHALFWQLKEAAPCEASIVGAAESALRIGRIAEGYAAAKEARERFDMSPAVVLTLGAAAHAAGDMALWDEVLAYVSALPLERAVMVYERWTDIAASASLLDTVCACGEKLVEIKPSAPRLRQLAEAALARQDVAKAQDWANRALALNERDGASLSLLARCEVLQGDLEAAKTLFRRAIEADPNAIAAYENLSEIDVRLLSDEDEARLAAWSADAELDADLGSKLFLTLGRIAESQGDFASAYDCFERAKAYVRMQAAAGGAEYNPEATEKAVARTQKLFATRARQRETQRDEPVAIFIIGMPRSGTSLIEQILASHPDVAGGGELKFMPDLFIELTTIAFQKGEAAATQAVDNIDWRARYFENLPSALREAKFFTDKHPLNFWGVGLIKSKFPTAKVIQLRRQPEAVFLSSLKRRFYRGYSFVNSAESLAHYQAAFEALMRHWLQIYGEDIYVADYEELTRNPESETRKLLVYCGLEWHAACLSFHKLSRDVYTHSAAQVREKIHGRSVDLWRRYGDKIRPFQKALDDARRRFGLA